VDPVKITVPDTTITEPRADGDTMPGKHKKNYALTLPGLHITALEAAMEADWLGRGIAAEETSQGHGFGFITEPTGVVTSIGRRNRDALLPAIEANHEAVA
jgi:hypothetical protein